MQNHDTHPEHPHRETLLTVVLTGIAACGFLLFLILISGGFFFYVMLAAAAITALGFFHYVLWGHAMTNEVTEQQALDATAEQAGRENDWLRHRSRPPRL